MITRKMALILCGAWLLALSGCSRQQSDWQKTRETNTTESYEQFLKKYPSGEFTAQAQARVKELYEEREWQKARDADTPEAYQAFLKQYPEGKWTEEARIRVENFTLAQAPSGSSPAPSASAANDDAAATNDASAPAQTPAQTPAAPASRTTPTPPSPAPSPHSAPPRSAAAATAAMPPASKGAALAPHAGGQFGVQLGAYKSGAQAAHEHWALLQKDYPRLFSGLTSKTVAKKTNAGTLYRLQVSGLSEAHARALCHGLKTKSQVCVVLAPPKG